MVPIWYVPSFPSLTDETGLLPETNPLLHGNKIIWWRDAYEYVKVSYEFTIIEGQVPDGDLYVITPHPEYTGDLLVKIYLTNTGALNRAYQYLNMKLYVEGSMEAAKTPDYLILSMENGVALFNIEGGSAESYTVEVTGGSYRLLSGDPEEWSEGWSITPEFYCEVTQR